MSFPDIAGYLREEQLKGFSRRSPEEKQAVLLGHLGHRVVSFDIEATHLKPNVGRTLCCSFKPLGNDVYTLSAIQKPFMRPDVYDDGRLVTAIRDELESYDIIVGHNGKMFDTRFINSRLLHAGQRVKRAQYQVDTMWAWRSKASAWSGLDNIKRFALPDAETSKTKVDWPEWMRALGWNKKLREAAMAEITDHCERDVIVLENAYRFMVERDVIRGLRRDGGVL